MPSDRSNICSLYVEGLNMKNGIKYSVEVVAVNGAGLSAKYESHGVIVDTTPPVMESVSHATK